MNMIGFELNHNGRITKGTVEKGVTTIFLSQHNGVVHLAFRGLDADLQQHLIWLESTAEENDNIFIKVVNIEKPSKVIKVMPENKGTVEDKINEYNMLKCYLEKEGLL